MKTFEAPKVEVVRFGKSNVIVTSCQSCPGCPPGSYGCPCVDSWSSNYAPKEPAVPGV